MRVKGFLGQALSPAGENLGCVYRVEGGYIVRKPTGRSIGPVAFGGRVFTREEMVKTGSIDYGYRAENFYTLNA